jgi:septal ring factor EnvC (AmiA/AmiB activator)
VQADKITSLNGQVAATTSENQALGRSVVDLTNQVATLTGQLTLIQTNLAENRKTLADVSSQNSLLQHAFLRDVAERVVVERKFNNPDQLRTQLQMLKTNAPAVITAERIYASLNVEVNSNGVAHVISPE